MPIQGPLSQCFAARGFLL